MKQTIMVYFVALLLGLGVTSAAAQFETAATGAYIYDVSTDTVLFEKNADASLPPASMSKLMTLNMLFEALREERVQLDTRFGVSEKAMAMGGSTMFLDTSDRPTVQELIQGIIVMSGNDACVVVAEALGGTEAAFAEMMTSRAQALGMTNSSFANASGLPDPDHRMSMRDLGTLAQRLITEFPEYYSYFSLREFPFDNRAPQNRFNRNPLLGLGIGADGLKTGHTREAGFGLTGSAVQGERRIVFAITGLTSQEARARESEAIVNWAFRQFAKKELISAGQELGRAEIWLGASDDVSLVAAENVTALLPVRSNNEIEAELRYTGPVEAPIAKGQVIGELAIKRDGLPDITIPVVTGADVEAAGFLSRVSVAADRVIAGISGAKKEQ